MTTSTIGFIGRGNVGASLAGNLLRHPCAVALRAQGASRVAGPLDVTERVTRDTFWVGVYPGIDDERVERVAKAIREAVKS